MTSLYGDKTFENCDQIELNFSMYHMLTPRSMLSQKEPDSLPEMSCKVQFLF